MTAPAKPDDDNPPYADGSMDAGLWCMAQLAPPYTRSEIAYVCDCSREWVRILEERALRKVLRRLKIAMEGEEITLENLLAIMPQTMDDFGGHKTPVQGSED